MDDVQLAVRVHAQHSPNLQLVPGLHLGARAVTQCEDKRMGCQIGPLKSVAKKDANTQVLAN